MKSPEQIKADKLISAICQCYIPIKKEVKKK